VRTYHDRKLDYFLRHPEHDYTLVYADDESGVEEFAPHARIVRTRGPRMDPNYRFVLNAITLRRVFDSVRPEVIEVGEPYFLPWVARVARAGKRIPILGYWHANFPVTYVRRPVEGVSRHLAPTCEHVAWWYARRTYGQLNGVLVAAQIMQKKLTDKGFSVTYHAPLGVDSSLFDPARRDPGLRASVGACVEPGAGTRPVIFFPHRLSEEKGLSVTLEAFARISRTMEIILVVAGTGPGESLLRSYMDRYPTIHYLGYLSDPLLVARWYASSDMLLALSPHETFGLTALEAMASGCPVVAAAGGALPELVQAAGCGAVLPHDRADLVAETVISLLADPRAHAAACAQARAFALEHHTWDSTFDNIVRCYDEAISQPRLRRAAGKLLSRATRSRPAEART
jgi:alpha-1,6-mannosyltransferase